MLWIPQGTSNVNSIYDFWYVLTSVPPADPSQIIATKAESKLADIIIPQRWNSILKDLSFVRKRWSFTAHLSKKEAFLLFTAGKNESLFLISHSTQSIQIQINTLQWHTYITLFKQKYKMNTWCVYLRYSSLERLLSFLLKWIQTSHFKYNTWRHITTYSQQCIASNPSHLLPLWMMKQRRERKELSSNGRDGNIITQVYSNLISHPLLDYMLILIPDTRSLPSWNQLDIQEWKLHQKEPSSILDNHKKKSALSLCKCANNRAWLKGKMNEGYHPASLSLEL